MVLLEQSSRAVEVEKRMPEETMADAVAKIAAEYGVPGLAAGVLADGRDAFAAYGVTSVDNPLPVDERTLFTIASVTKTFTATAVMRLVAEGRVELDAAVRRYVPELKLADEDAAARITVLQLLNHTAGLDWNVVGDDVDDTLTSFVAALAGLPLIAEPGARSSYSQAGYNLLGRVIENVTGQPFEQAIADLVLNPVGLEDAVFDLDDVIVRTFALGYNHDDDGTLRVGKPWKAFRGTARGNNPGGGLASTASDLLSWARFHLGDGGGVLPADVLHSMRTPTVALRASALGEAVGVCWFIREIGGVATIGHGGSGNGQFAELLIVPERDFAIVSLANSDGGYLANQAVLRWALEHYLGIAERAAEPVPYDHVRAVDVAGRYENDVMSLDIAADGTRLSLEVGIKPEIRAASDVEMPADYPPATIGFLPGDGDEYIITDGGLKGQRGYFSRDENGAVTGIDIAGRLFTRAVS
jgi:CubicO group peptidase (beta-lactamase class C family)